MSRLGVAPRIMTTGGIMAAPVAGALLERTGAMGRVGDATRSATAVAAFPGGVVPEGIP